MNKQLAAVVTILLFVTLCFSGCELLEEKPDYITVTCSAEIDISCLDKNNNNLKIFASGLPIRVDFVKAGGERFTLTCTSDTFGIAETGTCSFKLYKEQPIEVTMTVQGGYLDFYPKAPVQYQTLTWEVVDAAADFGGSYAWKPYFFVELYNTTSL
ncbi:MAG TPA: hypothetical protein VN365_05090 [Candidatus Thermoplasmatota archaeon]|nr:hypothetical protein [Candidatus Thermoplasmatota archaeon]